MRDFQIYWGSFEREGSYFIELLPGKFAGKWWNHESAYIEGDDFEEMLSGIFHKHAPDFDFYGETVIETDACWAIVDDLKATKNPSARELANWLHSAIARQGSITVLGI